jgi:hypothetical protein
MNLRTDKDGILIRKHIRLCLVLNILYLKIADRTEIRKVTVWGYGDSGAERNENEPAFYPCAR